MSGPASNTAISGITLSDGAKLLLPILWGHVEVGNTEGTRPANKGEQIEIENLRGATPRDYMPAIEVEDDDLQSGPLDLLR